MSAIERSPRAVGQSAADVRAGRIAACCARVLRERTTRSAPAAVLRAVTIALSVLAVTSGSAAPIRAQDGTRDPLVAAGGDPSELARAVERAGDEAVIERLSDGTPTSTRLAAIHAAPRMQGPERALERLAQIAAGRDPDLAPAAARALLEIATALDPRDLDAREVMRDELAPARSAVRASAEDESARGDVRRAAAIADAALAELGVPDGGS